MLSKTTVFILVLLIFASLLSGCSGGSYKISIGEIDASNNSLVGQYSSFTGSYFKKVKFEKGDVIEFNFEDDTVEGEIFAKLINSDGEVLVEIDDQPIITIGSTDTYKVQVEGKKHKGNFTLSWQEN